MGYGITGTPEVADAYRKIRINFSVNAVAIAGALAALAETAHTEALLEHTADERSRLGESLIALGFQVLPSAANFVTAIAPRPAGQLAAALRDENVFVLPMSWRDSPGALRITIGSRNDNDAVIAGLNRAMAVR